MLIKATHLFCTGVPAIAMGSLNCGLCGAIKGEGMFAKEREEEVGGDGKGDDLTYAF